MRGREGWKGGAENEAERGMCEVCSRSGWEIVGALLRNLQARRGSGSASERCRVVF